VSWSAGESIPARLLFPYPHPKALGLVMDPDHEATVKRIEPGSPADRDGFEAGDRIVSLAGQPLVSTADIQWVLHNAPAEGKVAAEVVRGEKALPLELTLAKGWRGRDDISWRASSWALRRMITGGLLLEEATVAERERAGLPDDALALKVRHVGEYGPHALAKQAGFQKDDIIVSVAGRSDAMRETDLFAYLLSSQQIGEEFPVTVYRDGNQLELTLRAQQ
jgi:S1-C subfamily serine protease